MINSDNEKYNKKINLDYLIQTPMFSSIKEVKDYNKKNIYLYNTHDLEEYSDGTTVNDVSIMLKNNLNKLGIDASVLLNSGLNYYQKSRLLIEKEIKENKYDYYIDIHRDDALDTQIVFNNKIYAKIMFVLGVDNPNYQKNKVIVEQMNNYLDINYPGISKGVKEKSGSNISNIYNQDLNENTLLIEVGGINNSKEEVNNSTEIIALMLYYILGD